MPASYLCYTDGSAKAVDGSPGGWGFWIKAPNGAPVEGHGSARGTLAKVMEYRAVAEALGALPSDVSAIVFSDNQSLVENLEKKLGSWVESSFRNVDPLIADSARAIADAIATKRLRVRWQWVRGHAGNVGNQRADALAALGTREAKAKIL